MFQTSRVCTRVAAQFLALTSIVGLSACNSSAGSSAPAAAKSTDTDSYSRADSLAATTAPSGDLDADLKAMWETKLITGEGTGVAAEHRFASTYRAINAASRVFNTISLRGMSRAQVIVRLGDPRASSNSIYNFPFYPPRAGDLTYRFDAGNGGWQFNIHFDADGKVSAVDRIGIE